MSLGSPTMSSPTTPTSASRIFHGAYRLLSYSKPTPPDFGKLSCSGPSPASTSGDTHSAGSFPATPMEDGDIGSSRPDPCSKYESESTKDCYATASPLSKRLVELGVTSTLSLATIDESMVPRNAGVPLMNLSTCDDLDSDHSDDIANHSAESPNSPSPSPSPKRMATSSFVQSPNAEKDDPFTSNSSNSTLDGIPLGKLLTTPSRRTQSANVTPNHRATKGSFVHDTPASSGRRSTKLVNLALTSTPFSPREVRQRETPSAENAQAIFPPEACVFVANLSSTCADEVLEKSVTEFFAKFGTVYVKIRRDGRGMPYAFCQYEAKDAAAAAIREGKDKVIAGRPCRTEISKAHRAMYVSKHDGSVITTKEIRDFLAGRGELDKIWTSTDTEREIYQLPHGMWVRFYYYQDCQDARSALRQDPRFKIDVVTETMKGSASRSARNAHPTMSSFTSPTRTPFFSGAPNTENSRTLYVGNLPPNINQQELCSMFGFYGVIVSAQVISNARNVHRIVVVYAFVEFMAWHSAISAVRGENGKFIRGYKVRVEHKDAAPRHPPPNFTPKVTRRLDDAAQNTALAFPSESQPAANYGSIGSFYQHQPTYSEQQFSGPMPNGYSDPSLSMTNTSGLYTSPNCYSYYPSAYHSTNNAAQNTSNVSERNVPGFSPTGPMMTHFAPDWFMPPQRQPHSFTSASMRPNTPSIVQYSQGSLPYAQYASAYYPYVTQQTSANPYAIQQANVGTGAAVHNTGFAANSTSGPPVETH